MELCHALSDPVLKAVPRDRHIFDILSAAAAKRYEQARRDGIRNDDE